MDTRPAPFAVRLSMTLERRLASMTWTLDPEFLETTVTRIALLSSAEFELRRGSSDGVDERLLDEQILLDIVSGHSLIEAGGFLDGDFMDKILEETRAALAEVRGS